MCGLGSLLNDGWDCAFGRDVHPLKCPLTWIVTLGRSFWTTKRWFLLHQQLQEEVCVLGVNQIPNDQNTWVTLLECHESPAYPTYVVFWTDRNTYGKTTDFMYNIMAICGMWLTLHIPRVQNNSNACNTTLIVPINAFGINTQYIHYLPSPKITDGWYLLLSCIKCMNKCQENECVL